MNSSDHSKSILKGQLCSEFSGATSVGTSIQDEKNIKVDALDGESSYTPRADTYASAALARSNRERFDRQKRSSWQHLLIMLNQIQESIETNFEDIERILDDIKEVAENTLNDIEVITSKIDNLERDHEVVNAILIDPKNEDLSTLQNNHHVQNVLNRAEIRTGQTADTADDLLFILRAQINHEQKNVIPELKDKPTWFSEKYDRCMKSFEEISAKQDDLKDQYRDAMDMSDVEEKLDSLTNLKTASEQLKTRSQIDYHILVNQDSENARVSNTAPKSIDIEQFGMNLSGGKNGLSP